MHLKDLQEQCQAYILNKQPLNFDLNSIVTHLSHAGLVSVSKGMQIYVEDYRVRLIEVLENDYSKLRMVLGEKKFKEIASLYIDQFPSHFAKVQLYGQHFATFLKSNPSAQSKFYFSELADFEWAIGESANDDDKIGVQKEILNEIPSEKWATMKIIFKPCLKILKFEWNVLEIWQRLESDESYQNENNEKNENGEPLFKKNKNPMMALIHPVKQEILFRPLEELEFQCIRLSNENRNFEEICEALTFQMNANEVPRFALSLLYLWLEENLIVDIQW